jgi:GT2 family glycosyltransferase
MTEKRQFSLSASIVLYKTPIIRIARLLDDLEAAGVARIFVVDNGPRDFTGTVAGNDSSIIERHHTGRNLGFGRAQNIAIRRSVEHHKYHLICNPDIAVPEGAISTLMEFMEANPDVGLCMPKLTGVDGKMQFCCRRSPVALDYFSQLILPRSWGRWRKDSLEMRSHNYNEPMEVECLSGCFMFFRSEVLRRLDGFDERFFLYFEDFDLSKRSQSLARNVYFPSTHVVHERQSEHKRSWRLKVAFALSAYRYFSKWGWF